MEHRERSLDQAGFSFVKVFGLPFEGDGELRLIAAGNSKCHPAAVGN